MERVYPEKEPRNKGGGDTPGERKEKEENKDAIDEVQGDIDDMVGKRVEPEKKVLPGVRQYRERVVIADAEPGERGLEGFQGDIFYEMVPLDVTAVVPDEPSVSGRIIGYCRQEKDACQAQAYFHVSTGAIYCHDRVIILQEIEAFHAVHHKFDKFYANL